MCLAAPTPDILARITFRFRSGHQQQPLLQTSSLELSSLICLAAPARDILARITLVFLVLLCVVALAIAP